MEKPIITKFKTGEKVSSAIAIRHRPKSVAYCAICGNIITKLDSKRYCFRCGTDVDWPGTARGRLADWNYIWNGKYREKYMP